MAVEEGYVLERLDDDPVVDGGLLVVDEGSASSRNVVVGPIAHEEPRDAAGDDKAVVERDQTFVGIVLAGEFEQPVVRVDRAQIGVGPEHDGVEVEGELVMFSTKAVWAPLG